MDSTSSADQKLPTAENVVRLADCIYFMQADLVLANPSRADLSQIVTDVLMYDPLDEWTDVEHHIILAVGIAFGSREFDQLMLRAAANRVAAVVIKTHGVQPERIRDQAESDYGVALLIAPAQGNWTRLASLARASVVGVSTDSHSGVRLGDLYALANTVASLAFGATSIVDPMGRIIGYSTLPGQVIDELRRVTTLSLQERLAPTLDEDFRLVYGSPSAVYIPQTLEGVSRLAIAVRAGGELLGSLWVVDPGPAQRQAALDALNRISPVAALHVLHARLGSDFGERRSVDLMRTLLFDPEHASFAASELGIDLSQGFSVAAITLESSLAGQLEEVREIHRLLHLVTTVCGVRFTSGHSILDGSVIFALFPCRGEEPRAMHRRVLEEIASYRHSVSQRRLVATVGSAASTLEELALSRKRAVDTAEYLLGDPRFAGEAANVALCEDHQVALNLLEIRRYILKRNLGQSDPVALIGAYDQENGTDYLPTLRSYLVHEGKVSAIAQELMVHGNTVRYRISQYQSLFGLDLGDPQARLWAWVRVGCLGPAFEG